MSIEEYLRRKEVEKGIRRHIGIGARNSVCDQGARMKPSFDYIDSYVTENYWNRRVKPTFLAFLKKIYGNRCDILPELSKNDIYSLAAEVRKPFEEARVTIKLINTSKIRVSPAIALIYNVDPGDIVDVFSTKNPYVIIRRNLDVIEFDGTANFTIIMSPEDAKLLYGPTDSDQLDEKIKIRKIFPINKMRVGGKVS